MELSPDDYSLVTNAATALRLLDRKVEAEVHYKQVSWVTTLWTIYWIHLMTISLSILGRIQAVQLRPNDPRAHTNYGAILHLMGRTQLAINSYRQALQLQPGDGTTLTNLAKLGVYEAA